MTDTMKPKSRLPITSARDYDNGQVNVYGVRMAARDPKQDDRQKFLTYLNFPALFAGLFTNNFEISKNFEIKDLLFLFFID